MKKLLLLAVAMALPQAAVLAADKNPDAKGICEVHPANTAGAFEQDPIHRAERGTNR